MHAARDLGCSVLAAGCATDHVHAVGRLAPAVSLSTLIGRMKGGSAFDIRHAAKVFPEDVSEQGDWDQSLDPSTLDGVARYVRDQRRRHNPSHPAELWLEGEAAKRSPEDVSTTLDPFSGAHWATHALYPNHLGSRFVSRLDNGRLP